MNAFRLVGAASGLALCALALCARAQAPRAGAVAAEPVVLEVPDCLDVRGADVTQLAALELAPRLRVTARAQAPVLTATVRCPAGAAVELVVDDPRRGEPLRSQLDLARTAPPARARLLALALSELIATSRMQRASSASAGTGSAANVGAIAAQPKSDAAAPNVGPNTAPRAEPAIDSAPDTDADADAETQAVADRARDDGAADESDADSADGPRSSTRWPWRLWAGPGVSLAADPATPWFGIDGGGSRAIGPFALGAELQARWASPQLDQADLSLQAFSAALTIAPVLHAGALALQAGPGVRAGHVRLAATARRDGERGDTLSGTWLGPLASVAAELALFGPGTLRLALEAGYAARSVAGRDAAGADLIALRGPWFSSSLAFAIGLR